jgi:hypothetical protein
MAPTDRAKPSRLPVAVSAERNASRYSFIVFTAYSLPVSPAHSALPSIPGMTVIGRKHLRLVPLRDSCSAANTILLDHLVSAGEERRWHFKSESLGGCEIDHQFKLCRQHDRQVGGLLALEDPASVVAGQTIGLGAIG